MATLTRTYSPGEPGTCTSCGRGEWLVQSFRETDTAYLVDLNAGSCTCPHFTRRNPEGGCKHIKEARVAAIRATREKARSMPAIELRKALQTRTYRPEIRDAVMEVLWEKLNAIVERVQEQVRSRTYLRV